MSTYPDVSIIVTIDGVDINLGISAKAQIKNDGQGKDIKTFFKTSTINYLINRAGKEFISGASAYRMYNGIAHNTLWSGDSPDIRFRKYMAAFGAYSALGGKEGGDEIYLISYVDKVISVEEFFDNIIKSKSFLDLELPMGNKLNKKKEVVSYGRKTIGFHERNRIRFNNRYTLAYE